MSIDPPGPEDAGDEAEFGDDAGDEVRNEAELFDDAGYDDADDDGAGDDEVSPREQLLLDRKELHELGLELDNPEGFADE
ncbi:MAG TPA: hypothetical protein VEJ87_15775 [Acidimicrobiales bacterium]|nr:hypothetical protein [Acidimicrobiales bacterium]